MVYDILTVAQKEIKEILMQRGSLRGGLIGSLVALGILGIFLPIQSGSDWVSVQGLITCAILPLFLSNGIVVDTFAGERERHTLETLLASRLSDRAILFGKLLATVGYSFALALLSMILGAVSVNVASPGAGFYPIVPFFGALVFAILGALLIASLGALVSLRAESVRQAYQRMSLGYWVILLPIFIGPRVLPPEWQAQFVLFLRGLDVTQVVIGAGVVLLIFNAALITAVLARFQRAKLILD